MASVLLAVKIIFICVQEC